MTRTKVKKLPPVPKRDEAPAMGLVSDKNFVKTNALEAMLAKPPKKEAPLLATQKKDYGKVPKYLHTIKSQIAAEKEALERQKLETLVNAWIQQRREQLAASGERIVDQTLLN